MVTDQTTLKEIDTPAIDPSEAITTWCDDAQWDELGDRLPMGARGRLKKINRNLFALNSILSVLFRDNLGKEDQRTNEVNFTKALSAYDALALSIAAIALSEDAENTLAEVREGKFS